MALSLFLLQVLLSGSNTSNLMAVETSFLKGTILKVLLFKVNYFVVDKDKSLFYRGFIEAEINLFCCMRNST